MTKHEIRIRQKELRIELSVQERESLCKAIRDQLFQTKAYKKCEYVFSFVSFGSEIDTKEIILQALIDGKRVYVPRVEAHGLEFYEIKSLEGLIISKFNVPEPPKKEENRFGYEKISMQEQRFTDYSRRSDRQENFENQMQDSDMITNNRVNYDKLMLLPGLAFDRSGNRIGYGAGYYDKYLSTHLETHFYKTALAYDFQIINNIIADEYDVKADAILSPTQYIFCS